MSAPGSGDVEGQDCPTSTPPAAHLPSDQSDTPQAHLRTDAAARRDALGRRVREVWIEWAKTQPDPKPSWLVTYDDLSEADKEADRCIGSALHGDGIETGMRMHAAMRQTLAAARPPRDDEVKG